MSLKTEAKWSTCKCCGRKDKLIRDEVWGCDGCGKDIDHNEPDRDYLRAQVFRNDGSASEALEFCSWKCAIKGLRKVKSDYFVSMPYLHYDSKSPGIRASDFFKLVKP